MFFAGEVKQPKIGSVWKEFLLKPWKRWLVNYFFALLVNLLHQTQDRIKVPNLADFVVYFKNTEHLSF